VSAILACLTDLGFGPNAALSVKNAIALDVLPDPSKVDFERLGAATLRPSAVQNETEVLEGCGSPARNLRKSNKPDARVRAGRADFATFLSRLA
jgi:hypothetical protein